VIVEFAISFFLIFWTFSGMFQFGYAFYAYNNLINAVRDGARYGSICPYSSTTTTPDATYSNNVKNMVVYGTPAPAQNATPVVAGLSTSNVNITMATLGTGTLSPPSKVTVSIQNFSINVIFGSVTFNGRPVATFPYTGILTPPS
jgi:Flp pilus assembly protein TadG